MKRVLVYLMALLVIFSLTACYRTYTISNNEIISHNTDDTPDPENNVSEEKTDETERKTVKVNLTLYFPDDDALYLHPEKREVEVYEDELLAETVIEQLFAGPETEGLSPCLDGRELVNSVTVRDGLCTIDFKDDFAILNSGGTARETFAIGSIVNSLCELEGIEKVKINIAGDSNAAFGGHFTLEAPFTPQKDLIK